MASAPDGQTLASTSADRTTRLWNVATGLELLDVDEPEELSGVWFANGGRTLITTTQDSNRVILWHSDLDQHGPGTPPQDRFSEVSSFPSATTFVRGGTIIEITGGNQAANSPWVPLPRVSEHQAVPDRPEGKSRSESTGAAEAA